MIKKRFVCHKEALFEAMAIKVAYAHACTCTNFKILKNYEFCVDNFEG